MLARLCAGLTAFLLAAGAAVAAEPDASDLVASVRRDTEWLASFPTRVVGTESHDAAGAALLERIKAIPGVIVRTHEFSVVLPEVLEATLTAPGSGEHPVYPFWPSGSRLVTTPSGGISGRLVYIGEGRPGRAPGHLPASGVSGQIAVMEATGGKRWMNAYNAGARAIIVLGSPDVTYRDLRSHLLSIPINIPRFYVPDGKLARALRAGELHNGTVVCRARWERKTARNIYALVLPAEPARRPQNRQAFVVGVHYDSMSLVPGLAPGADAAIDVAFGLTLLRHTTRHPPKRPLLVAFTDAYGLGQRGVREMLGAFATVPKDYEAHLSDDFDVAEDYGAHELLAQEIDTEYESALASRVGKSGSAATEEARMLARRDAMGRLHESRYRDLRRYLKDEVARRVVAIETILYPKRTELSRLRGERTALEAEIESLEETSTGGSATLIAEKKREVRELSLRTYALQDEATRLDTERIHYYGAQRRLHTDAPLKDIDSFKLAGGRAMTEADFRSMKRARSLLASITLAGGGKLTPVDIAALAGGQRPPGSLELADGTRPAADVARALVEACKTVDSTLLADGSKFTDEDFNAIASSRIADELWQLARSRIRRQLAATGHVVAQYRQREARRREMLDLLGLTDRLDRPLGFLLGLDLSDAGVVAGPCLVGSFMQWDGRRDAGSLTNWLQMKDAQADGKFWPETLRPAVSLNAHEGTESPWSEVVGRVANISAPAASFATAGMAWNTLDAERLYVDTPNDLAERLDWRRLAPQIDATFFLLTTVLGDTTFVPIAQSPVKWTRVHGVIVDRSPGEPVPSVPMEGYLVAYVPGWALSGSTVAWHDPVPGVRRLEFAFTRVDGRFRFDLIPLSGWSHYYTIQPSLAAEDGRLVRRADLLKGERGGSLQVNINDRNPNELRAVMFDCTEVTVVDFFDPRFLLMLPDGKVHDARRGSQPQRLNFTRQTGHMVMFVEPSVRWQLLLRHGITENRMALLNVVDPDDPGAAALSMRKAMRGFSAEERSPERPVLQAARDFYRLDRRRVEKYKRAGIASEHIEAMQAETKGLLDAADEAAAADRDDGRAFTAAATAALANEVRAYKAIRETANDVVRGAIFLLLMAVPFAFVMERLLFASPNIYKQIGAVLGVFVLMAAALWSFHPAFRITGQPLMVIMAFAALGMSVLVMGMIFSKFEGLLEEFRSGRAEASGARTSRIGLAYTAIRLGIANMRKRKLRTALTGITIVLITFALLCYMSTSTYDDKKEMELDTTAPFTGVLVAQPSSRAMPDEALESLETIVPGPRAVVPRYWWVSNDPKWRVHARNPVTGDQVSLSAALGLVGREADCSGIDRFCPNWSRFDSGNGCYLSADTAERLGVEPGGRVVIAGRSLELLGTFKPKVFDQQVQRLDGRSILPFDFTILDDKQRTRVTRQDLTEMTREMTSGSALVSVEDSPHAPGDQVVIVHASLLRGLYAGSLRHLTVPVGSYEKAKELAERLADRLAFPVYYGAPRRKVKVMASTLPIPKPPKALVIPLAIAGLIIFNTMLSSIAERKREIYIYTSLGLAPLHVGFLFLAEALTYGLMGSVFGYVVGQGAAKLFSSMGLMTGVTLNYSGGQAIFTMLIVLATVIVSSLVPAFLAGKLATPSNEMTWKVPLPDGDTIRDRLPFTATPRTAGGILVFIYEYMDAHRGGTIGVFSADNLEKSCDTDDDGREVHIVRGTVWLAPYDLGVRQDVTITVHVSATEPDVYEIDVELVRRSGQIRTWRKLNRVLLGDLRRQLLGWRKLKIDRVLEYIARATESGMPLEA